jgi:hypothetical protein
MPRYSLRARSECNNASACGKAVEPECLAGLAPIRQIADGHRHDLGRRAAEEAHRPGHVEGRGDQEHAHPLLLTR